NAQFVNDWGANNHEIKATLAANAVITSDTITIYDRVGPLATGVLKRNDMTGVQIIGDVVLTAPEVAVSGNAINIVDGDSTPSVTDGTDFGTTFQGTPVSHIFRVDNTGTAALNTSGLTVPAGYSITEPLSAAILAGGFDTF